MLGHQGAKRGPNGEALTRQCWVHGTRSAAENDSSLAFERASTLVASQLPVQDWHASIGDPNLADAICDRILSNAHRIHLKGPSIRPTQGDSKSAARTKA
jgi:hypothetical protein